MVPPGAKGTTIFTGRVGQVPCAAAGTAREASAVMALAVRVAQALQVAFQPAGMNLWQSNGHAGGQEVPHFHLHVHPRGVADGLLRVYPQGLPAPAKRTDLDKMSTTLRAALKD